MTCPGNRTRPSRFRRQSRCCARSAPVETPRPAGPGALWRCRNGAWTRSAPCRTRGHVLTTIAPSDCLVFALGTHTEVIARRNAGTNLQRHLFENGTLYSSSEPCPMCLTACYWVRIPRIVYGATSNDVATCGFEDLLLHRELGRPAAQRSLREDAADEMIRTEAAAVLSSWAAQLPGETATPLAPELAPEEEA